MGADKSTIFQNAQRFASRGQLDKAIEEWTKLAAQSPTDGTIYNTIGDLHLKRNAPAAAIESYLQAAVAFQQRGFALKTIAVYKKILKIDPKRYQVYRYLADLNAERGLVRNAITDYLTVAKFYLDEGNTREALEVYRTIAKLDPSDLSVRRKVAELSLKANLREEAITEYLNLGRECAAQQRPNEARDAYRAVLQIDPDHREAQQLLNSPQGSVQSYRDIPQTEAMRPESVPLQEGPEPQVPATLDPHALLEEAIRQINSGEYSEAEATLHWLLALEPAHPDVPRLLATLRLERGELAAARTDFESLAQQALRAQDYGLAESLIREYLRVDPKCVALLELLGRVCELNGDPMSAAIQYGKAVELLLESPDPERPDLPAELYGKIKLLAPTSPIVRRFAAAFETVPSYGDARGAEEPGFQELPPRQSFGTDASSDALPAGFAVGSKGASNNEESPRTAPAEIPPPSPKKRRISYL